MMNRKSTPAIPEPIAELQRQLDQFRSTQPRRTKLPGRVTRVRAFSPSLRARAAKTRETPSQQPLTQFRRLTVAPV